jgi:glyoxylase-like metal-dependent hydrolase (beta-lactamase superfamily II)
MAAPPRTGQTAHTARGSYTLHGALDATQVGAVVRDVRPAGWQFLNAAEGAPAGEGVPYVAVTPCLPPLTPSALDAAVAACDALPTPAVIQCSTATRAAAVLAAALAGPRGDAARLARATGFNATAPAAQAWLTAWTESKKGEGGEAPRGVAPLFLRTLRSTDGASTALSYLLADADTREAVVIDAVDAHAGRDAALVRELGFSLTFAVDTAAATGHAALARATGCRTLAPAGAADGRLRDGDAVVVGRHALRVLSAPGATPASLSLVLDDETRPGAFTGGGLLARGCGRADSEGGSAAQLCRSVVGRVFTLPDRYAVWPARAHGGMTESTVGEEKAHIPLLGGGKTDAECVAAAAALEPRAPA